jgi:uncharacterized protein (TIGR02996 family)
MGRLPLEALLAAIHADPADDAPRLVYADALLQQGDPRGEWIALQCTLRRTADDHLGWPDMMRRERALWNAHAQEWHPPMVAEIERGFPSAALARCAELPQVARALPTVRHAQITPAINGDLVDLGGMTTISGFLQDRGLVLGTPALSSLRRLEVPYCMEAGLATLPRPDALDELVLGFARPLVSDALPPIVRGLTALTLHRLGFAPEHMRAARRDFAGLRHLELFWPLPDPGELLASTVPGVLDTFLLTGVALGPAHDLLAAPQLAGLRRLRLAGAQLTPAGLTRLLSSLGPVWDLALPACGIDAGALAQLAGWSGAGRLRRLDLSGNPLYPGSAEILANAFPALTRLRVDNTRIGDAGIDALARGSLLPHLVALDLRNCDVSPAGFVRLAGVLGERMLSLDLRKNVADAASVAALGVAPRSFQPVELRLPTIHGVSTKALIERYRLGAATGRRLGMPHLELWEKER